VINYLTVLWSVQVGLVSQEPTLFATSIRENIAMGLPGASDAEIIAAAAAANAERFINKLPDGINTQVRDLKGTPEPLQANAEPIASTVFRCVYRPLFSQPLFFFAGASSKCPVRYVLTLLKNTNTSKDVRWSTLKG
jgi:hypothetical protein